MAAAVETTNQKRVALLLPGMTLNGTVFPDLGIATISPDFTRLVVGPEGWSAELARRRMALYAELVTEQLRRTPAWQAERRVVIGHSFGGMLALQWLLEFGSDPIGRVDGLILIGTTAGPMFEAVRLRVAGIGTAEWRVPVGRLMGLWNHRGVTRGMAGMLNRRGALRTVDFQQLRRRGDVAVGIAGWLNTDWRARRSFRFAMEGFDVRDRLAELRVPVIVLHGSRDTYFPLPATETWVRRLPRAELRPVAGAAHVLPLTHPQEVLKAAQDALR